MSAESAQAFMERMKSDEEFAKRVAAAESKEDRWAIVKAEGYDFTEEEVQAAASELSDGDLEGVAAGGISGGWGCGAGGGVA